MFLIFSACVLNGFYCVYFSVFSSDAAMEDTVLLFPFPMFIYRTRIDFRYCVPWPCCACSLVLIYVCVHMCVLLDFLNTGFCHRPVSKILVLPSQFGWLFSCQTAVPGTSNTVWKQWQEQPSTSPCCLFQEEDLVHLKCDVCVGILTFNYAEEVPFYPVYWEFLSWINACWN